MCGITKDDRLYDELPPPTANTVLRMNQMMRRKDCEDFELYMTELAAAYLVSLPT